MSKCPKHDSSQMLKHSTYYSLVNSSLENLKKMNNFIDYSTWHWLSEEENKRSKSCVDNNQV